ncbi:MAG: acyl-CoA dehydrogenase family protein [Anaerolineales bacterium]|nr:acyl-CoA dehydrogenase family protein [Anaerolineales bacterium]
MRFKLEEEQRLFRNAVRDFAETELKSRAREIDETATFPSDLIPTMADIGLMSMAIPEEYGGVEADAISTAIGIEEIGRVCGSTGLSIAAHTGLGCFPLVRWGSPEQKSRWLPVLADGSSLGALCLTEPGAGSDLRSVQTRAVKKNGDWIVNGTKAWITNPSLSQVQIVFLRIGDDFSMLLIESNQPGVTIHPAEKKMGVRGSPTHQVSYDDVRVPAENILGIQRRGLQQTLETLDGGRISIGALSVGIAQGAFEEAQNYAKQRTAFGKPIAQFQAIQWMLADAATEIEAARLLVYRAAWLKDSGERFTSQAAMAKLFASEMAERVTRNAVQILGSYGYSQEYPVERMYRDARLMTIGEGTSQIQRMVIARQFTTK